MFSLNFRSKSNVLSTSDSNLLYRHLPLSILNARAPTFLKKRVHFLMDQTLEIVLQTLCGSQTRVQCRATDTLRTIVFSTLPIAPASYCWCASNSRPLQLDLTLGLQHVQPNDTISVMFVKPDPLPSENPFIMSRRRKQRVFEEHLRVSDLSFWVLESFKDAREIYRMLSEENQALGESRREVKQSTVTINQIPKRISTDPLPPCWKTENSVESLTRQRSWPT
jgi:hypothetical protein